MILNFVVIDAYNNFNRHIQNSTPLIMELVKSKIELKHGHRIQNRYLVANSKCFKFTTETEIRGELLGLDSVFRKIIKLVKKSIAEYEEDGYVFCIEIIKWNTITNAGVYTNIGYDYIDKKFYTDLVTLNESSVDRVLIQNFNDVGLIDAIHSDIFGV